MYSRDSVVEHRVGEIHVDAAKGIHAVYKPVEIELDEMVDRYPEVLLDGVDQVVRPVGPVVQGGVHFLVRPDVAVGGHGREQVARDRQY